MKTKYLLFAKLIKQFENSQEGHNQLQQMGIRTIRKHYAAHGIIAYEFFDLFLILSIDDELPIATGKKAKEFIAKLEDK